MLTQYKNKDGVVISAEQITDDKEHADFWLTIDKDGNKGRVPDELFKRAFSPVEAEPPSTAPSTAGS